MRKKEVRCSYSCFKDEINVQLKGIMQLSQALMKNR